MDNGGYVPLDSQEFSHLLGEGIEDQIQLTAPTLVSADEPESEFLRTLRKNYHESSQKRAIYLNQKVKELLSVDILSKPNVAKQSIDYVLKRIDYDSRQANRESIISLEITENTGLACVKEFFKLWQIVTREKDLAITPYFNSRYWKYVVDTYHRFLQLLSDETGIAVRGKDDNSKTCDSGIKLVSENKKDRTYYVLRIWWYKLK